MATVSLSFAGIGDKNPFLTSDHPNGANFTSRGASSAQVFSQAWYGNNSSANTLWSCDFDPGVNQFSAYVEVDTPDSNSRGVCFFNASGNGFMFIARNNDVRVFALTAWALSGSVLVPYTTTVADDAIVRVDVTQNTGTYVVKVAGATVGTFVNTTYTSGLKCGPVSRGAGRIKNFTLEYTPAQTIDTINGGNPVKVGQQNVVINHTGFTGAITSVTTNRTGVNCSIVSGDANSTTVNVSGWVEAGNYPVTDISVQYTLSRSGESASASQTLTRPAGYSQVTFSGAIIDNQNLLGYHINAAGHTVEGGTAYYDTTTVASLTVYADTDWSSDPAGGTFDLWFIPVSGATAGKSYKFEVTVQNGEIVDVSGGLTSVGLTSVGLTSVGLTAVGL